MAGVIELVTVYLRQECFNENGGSDIPNNGSTDFALQLRTIANVSNNKDGDGVMANGWEHGRN